MVGVGLAAGSGVRVEQVVPQPPGHLPGQVKTSSSQQYGAVHMIIGASVGGSVAVGLVNNGTAQVASINNPAVSTAKKMILLIRLILSMAILPETAAIKR